MAKNSSEMTESQKIGWLNRTKFNLEGLTFEEFEKMYSHKLPKSVKAKEVFTQKGGILPSK